MKKSVIAIIAAAVVLVAFLGGFLLGRGDHKEPSDVSTVQDSAPEVTPEDTDAPNETPNPSGAEEIDEALIPILPEITAPEPEIEEPEEDDSLTIVFFGDSQFENGGDNKTDIPHLVHDYINARVLNLGAGGTCAALVQNDSNDLENWDNLSFYGMTLMLEGTASRGVLEGKHQLTVMEAIDPARVDYYVISYGINDFLNGVRNHISGEESNPRTYFGALTLGINNLKKISPQAQVIVCSPTYTQFFNSAGHYIGDSHIHDYGIGVFDEYANQAGHVANNTHSLFLDAAFDTMIDINGYTARDYLMDGIHLTEKGRQAYALALSYIIARDRGWTDRQIEQIEINNLDANREFLSDIPR